MRCSFIVGLSTLLTASALASPRKTVTQYAHAVWTQAEGLPQDTIRAIAQTTDGQLWLATEDGLVRFDGLEFVNFNKQYGPLRGYSIRALAADRDGDLWTATTSGLIRFSNGKFQLFTTRDGLPDNMISALYLDHRGTLWIGAGGLLCRFENGRFTTLPESAVHPLHRVVSMYEDDEKNLVIAGDGGLARRDGAGFATLLANDGLDPLVASIRDRDGNFWIGGLHGITVRRHDGSIRRYGVRDGLPSDSVRALTQDRDGNLWVGTRGGLARLEGDRFVSAYDESQTRDEVLSLFEDREGNLWVGTKNGLHRFRDDAFTNFGRSEGFPSDKPTAVFQDSQGRIWIGFQDAGLVVIKKDGSRRRYTTHEGLLDNEIYSVRETRDYQLLALTTKGIGVLRSDWFANYILPPNAETQTVDLLETRSGKLRVAATFGLYEVDGSSLRNMLPHVVSPQPASTTPVTLAEGSDGTLWAGTYGAGLWRIRGRDMHRYTAADGLGSDQIRSLYFDRDGTLWIGTFGAGLVEFRHDTFTQYMAKDGLLSDNIAHIIDDGAGSFWLATTKGICRVAKRELRDFREGHSRSLAVVNYGTDDGLRSAQCASGFYVSEGGSMTSDGRLWFPTARGLAMIDPACIGGGPPQNTLATYIVGVAVDGRELDPGQSVRMKAGSNHLQFRYKGIHLAAPERVRYDYMLEGLDTDWTQASNRRVVDYQIPRPGSYRFRVRATVPGQSASEASFAFEISPHFYQQNSFTWLCLILLASFVYAFHQLRLRQMRSRFSLVLEERARIAREIHDTLAQAFVGVSSLLDVAMAETIEKSGAASRHLDIARKAANHGLTEAKRSVMELRASALENKDLPSAISDAVSGWRLASSVAISLEVSGERHRLPESIQQNTFRVVQEAVTNGLKHAAAAHIRIHLHFEARRLMLTVEDDGRGFEPAATRSALDGHLGVLGMHERAEQMDGDLQLVSGRGRGTEVRLRVPLPPAVDPEGVWGWLVTLLRLRSS